MWRFAKYKMFIGNCIVNFQASAINIRNFFYYNYHVPSLLFLCTRHPSVIFETLQLSAVLTTQSEIFYTFNDFKIFAGCFPLGNTKILNNYKIQECQYFNIHGLNPPPKFSIVQLLTKPSTLSVMLPSDVSKSFRIDPSNFPHNPHVLFCSKLEAFRTTVFFRSHLRL